MGKKLVESGRQVGPGRFFIFSSRGWRKSGEGPAPFPDFDFLSVFDPLGNTGEVIAQVGDSGNFHDN